MSESPTFAMCARSGCEKAGGYAMRVVVTYPDLWLCKEHWLGLSQDYQANKRLGATVNIHTGEVTGAPSGRTEGDS